MKISVYLDKEIVDVLNIFGDLSAVTNEILTLCEQGAIDLMDKPNAFERSQCGRYTINIDNDYYISLYEEFGATSQRISIRRLLYWFVDNEVYEELDWKVGQFVDKAKINNKIGDSIKSLKNLQSCLPKTYYDKLQDMVNILKNMSEN